MSEIITCGLAAETKVETPEGSLTIRTCAGKAIPVLTHNEEGEHLFRMMLDVRKVADAHPVLKITMANGASFRVAGEQMLYTPDLKLIAAAKIGAGTALYPAFHYPAGYQYQVDAGGEAISDAAVHVKQVEPAGTAELYALGVHQTGCFFLAAGVLCRGDGKE